jgi:hypothetical protein
VTAFLPALKGLGFALLSADYRGAMAGRPPLQTMLERAESGVLLLGITPPRRSNSAERIREIADLTVKRLAGLDLDGLVLYDIDDESDRNPEQRPFPYLPTLDPAEFHAEHLDDWRGPVIIYRCVGKYAEDELRAWLREVDTGQALGVFVGASSGDKPVRTQLSRARQLRDELRADLLLGAVTITERHEANGDEHLRMLAKQESGCTFFISQVVYNVAATRRLLADYREACAGRGVGPRPVIFTLSVCGSVKTLEFLHWLGVDVPQSLEDHLRHSRDPLAESARQCEAIAGELARHCRGLELPFGFNVESVSIRKAEIEASVTLAAHLREVLDQVTGR